MMAEFASVKRSFETAAKHSEAGLILEVAGIAGLQAFLSKNFRKTSETELQDICTKMEWDVSRHWEWKELEMLLIELGDSTEDCVGTLPATALDSMDSGREVAEDLEQFATMVEKFLETGVLPHCFDSGSFLSLVPLSLIVDQDKSQFALGTISRLVEADIESMKAIFVKQWAAIRNMMGKKSNNELVEPCGMFF